MNHPKQDEVGPEYTTDPRDIRSMDEKRWNASERGWWRERSMVRPLLASRERVRRRWYAVNESRRFIVVVRIINERDCGLNKVLT